MRVCQYVTDGSPLYLRMVANSISMLRRHNDRIKVRLFVVHHEPVDTQSIEDLNVEVVQKEPEDSYFQANKTLFKEIPEPSFLFLDADTFVFGDVEYLFDKYAEYDYVGLPIYDLRLWKQEWLPFKPYNSSVNLWNNNYGQKFGMRLPSYCRMLREQTHPIAKWCYESCQGTNREELATSMFVNEENLSNYVWDRGDVRNAAGSQDFENTNTCIFHTYKDGWGRAYNEFCIGRKHIQPKFLRPKNYNKGCRKRIYRY